MRNDVVKFMKLTFSKFRVLINDLYLYLKSEKIKRSKLERFKCERKQASELNDIELEEKYVEYKVKLTRQQGYMTLWVSCIFAAIFTNFSHSIETWVALLATQLYGKTFLKDIDKLSMTDKLFSEFISMTLFGFIIIIIIVFFITFIKVISDTKRKLLIIEGVREKREKSTE